MFECGCQGSASFSEELDAAPPKYQSTEGAMDLVVTVPEGFKENNLIIVKSPFGTRTVQVIVPEGMVGGDKFVVTLPPPTQKILPAESPDLSSAVSNFVTPTPVVVGRLVNEEDKQ